MTNNLDNDRTVTTGKMYPIDLAPQKITIVKGISSNDVKMTHLIPGQTKTTNNSQMISHGGTGSMGLMRTATQIISPGVTSQGAQIVSQGSQLIGQSSQIISQPQLITTGQILSPGTQIISQGTQLSAQVSNANNAISNNGQTNVTTTGNSAQLLNVGGLVSGSGNLVVGSSVRTLPPSVRVLPSIPQHNTRPALPNMNVNSGVLVSKGVTSHVPRGLAAGASLAIRPVTNPQPASNQGAWSSSARGGRGRALVYGCRARSPAPRAPPAAAPLPAQQPPSAASPAPSAPQPSAPAHSSIVTLAPSTVLTSSCVISNTVRGAAPRAPAPSPSVLASRPLPLLQRNYQPAKVVGVASVGVRGVGNSAPPQLYYEVPRPAHHLRPVSSAYAHAHAQPPQSNLGNTAPASETRQQPSSVQSPLVARPSILRKREVDGSPTKLATANTVTTLVGNVNSIGQVYRADRGGERGDWEDVPRGGRAPGSGSTTISAPASPAAELEPDPPAPAPAPGHAPRVPAAAAHEHDLSPRKKPRKQTLINEIRQYEFPAEDVPPSPPPPATLAPLPKRPSLSGSYVCGWRSTERHFTRPGDVRRKDVRARDIVAIAGQKHVLTSAEGWKVHHLTAQMDDLVSLELDVSEQLAGILHALETTSARALLPIQTLQHTLLELIKGNIQRSKIVCEGIQEAREDILRVFKHRNFVSDILTRQADKRCFRKHRSQS